MAAWTWTLGFFFDDTMAELLSVSRVRVLGDDAEDSANRLVVERMEDRELEAPNDTTADFLSFFAAWDVFDSFSFRSAGMPSHSKTECVRPRVELKVLIPLRTKASQYLQLTSM